MVASCADVLFFLDLRRFSVMMNYLPDYSEQEQLGYVLYVTVCVTNAFEKIIILLTGDLPQQKTSIYLLHKTSNKTETENIQTGNNVILLFRTGQLEICFQI
jgi:hypothetical protein